METPAIRPYCPGDEKAISTLFKECFGRPLPTGWWQWRFLDNPSGRGLVYLAWDAARLCAHYAVTAVPLMIDGHEVLSGLSGTTMTHEDYRGIGLFPLLGRATYEAMATKDMPLVWGFPNLNSHRGFVRGLNWRDIYEIPTFRWMLPTDRKTVSSLDGVEEVSDVDERFNRLWSKECRSSRVMVRRNAEYLRWRYVNNPAERYRFLVSPTGSDIDAYAVFKQYGRELQIVDILGDVNSCVNLVTCIASVARRAGLPSISMWLNVTHPLHRRLEALGFGNDAPVTYMSGLVIVPSRLEDSVYTFRNWHVTMGDSDVY